MYIPGTVNTQKVNRYANRVNINADDFNLTSGQSIVLDSDSYINNKTIQVNEYNTGLTVEVSLDGVEFFPGPAISAIGIYIVPLPCRYLQFTAAGDCSGLVLGSL